MNGGITDVVATVVIVVVVVVVVTGIYTWFDAGRPGIKRPGQEDWSVWQRANDRVQQWAAEQQARKESEGDQGSVRPAWACRYCGSTDHSTDYHAGR